VFLACNVKILTFFATNEDFSGKLVEGLEALFRPSTWQVACVFLDVKLVGCLSSLGKPRQLVMTIVLAIFGYNHK
jgi:hypothetical protein